MPGILNSSWRCMAGDHPWWDLHAGHPDFRSRRLELNLVPGSLFVFWTHPGRKDDIRASEFPMAKKPNRSSASH